MAAVTVTQAAFLMVPALLLSIAAGLGLARTPPDWLAPALEAAPLVVFGGGAGVGILLRRGRLVLGLVVLGLADLALVHVGGRAVFDAVALLLPLNLGVIAWLGEMNLVTTRGASWLGVPLAQAAVVATLRHPELATLTERLEQPLVDMHLGVLTSLPHVVLVAFALSLGLVLIRLLLKGRALPVGAAWALVASFLALDGVGTGRPASVYFVTAGLLLVIGAVLEPPRAAYLDDTTGLPGRLALHEALRRLRRSYALASVEIDEFRTFREAHGSDAARRMLRLVAGALAKVGGGGRAFYCEGHAFAVVFRGMSVEAAARHLDVVRRAVEVATVDVRVPERPRPGTRTRPARVESADWTVAVTISAGVAQPAKRGVDPHEVLRAAGRALDQGKQAGLSRVSMATQAS